MAGGRPRMIESPEQLFKSFKDYVAALKANPIKVHDYAGKDADEVYRRKERPLTMEGFENYVYDIGGPISLEHYFANSNDKYDEFCTICRAIKREIRADQIEGGMVGIYNPSITQRLNSLVDKQEVKTDTTADSPVVNIYNNAPPLAGSEKEIDA
jgi:hypothetical protein